MSVDELLEGARSGREARKMAAAAAEEVDRQVWAHRLSEILDESTWATLGIDPHDADIEMHHHANSYRSLGRVIKAEGEVEIGNRALGIVFLMPQITTYRAECMLQVPPVHGTYQKTLWYPKTLLALGDGASSSRLGPEDQIALEADQKFNAGAVGDLILRYVESRLTSNEEVEVDGE